MTEVYLKFNQQTERYDCYNSLTDEFEQTLTSGNSFIYLPHDEDEEIAGRIEYDSNYGYYWVDRENFTRQKLFTGMRGYI
ncbi:DUF5348 domain-containing protein [Intestinibacter bartlettii]|mgnify:CR=1 FL=1|jgi:hypothetical protein|uniref:DUF5348 domain-containing protein n=1 Tax=Intestinibacter bartlettii TaxID=261299 RepID=UPI0024312104|nr:DUF5348 domain-containing protein [Intestinibacter bartlettii]